VIGGLVKIPVLLLLLTIGASTIAVPVSGQRAGNPVIVVFAHDAPFRSFPAGREDARARANPAAWVYLDRQVLGTVQLLERQHGFRADHVYSSAVRGFAARLTPAQIEALQRDPLIAYIEPDGAVEAFEQVVPWGIAQIGADVSSTRAGDGAGDISNVNVYILDNGVDAGHPDLNVIPGVNFTTAGAGPTCAHGTRVAGVLAARDNTTGVVGVMPGAPITPVKVTTCDPVIGSTSTVIKGIDWVTQNARKPAVANMSIGGFPSTTLDTAVKRSADSGVFYAIAAGNSSMDACFTSPQRVGPYAGVMTVAATTRTNAAASFSNYGRCVDIWAPGAEILTTDLGGTTVVSSGTSYASPHVAGTAGLYLSSHPTVRPADVEIALKTGAALPGTTSRDGKLIKVVNARGY
jgi:subtilisin family serine protease